VISKIRSVAYKLDLPPTTLIHPVFHVSQLKRHAGNHTMQGTPPTTPQTPVLQPRTILERQIAKRQNQAITQVLIHWEGLSPADATWEYIDELKWRFPQFNLGDKVGFKKGQLFPAEGEGEE
jgi:hypothetical protein